jgi:hypothetical protein
MELTEHFLRLAVRVRFENVKGEVDQEWHKKSTKWLNENCTEEEATLLRNFYTYNQTVYSCNNYSVVKQIEELAARFATDLGLR